MADIGIDLGTTNSVLAFLRGGAEVISIRGKQLLPSAVALDEGDWVIGYGAKSLAASIPENVVISPKRSMGTDTKYTLGGKTYTPVDMSAKILAEIKKHAEQFLGEPVDSAIVTIPAHFNQQQVEDTKKAAEQAGLKVAKLLAEPVAAAATYIANGDEKILVFDMGGGTLDCTVVDMFDNQIIGLDGDNWLGGDDFDARIVDRMCEELKKQGFDAYQDAPIRRKMKVKAEVAKINLSETNSTQVEFNQTVNGKTYALDFRMTRKEYNALIEDLVTRAIDKAKQAVQKAEMDVGEVDVVLLVGGSTLTPYVQERLQQEFGKPPMVRVDQMLAVALGAAICTRHLAVNPGEHRVKLRSRAEVWSEPEYTVLGRTTPHSRVAASGGAAAVETTANADGTFELVVPLQAGSVNDITVEATTPAGETSKAMHRIRHDVQAMKKVEPSEMPEIKPQLPRNILLGVNSKALGGGPGDYLVSKIVDAHVSLPVTGQSDEYGCPEPVPNPFTLQIPVYEGHEPEHEIPVGEFNTYLGMLNVSCPATTQPQQVVISFEIDDSRNMLIRCWFKSDPSVSNEIRLNGQALSSDKLHLVERTEKAINLAGSRLRPDEKARLNRKKQALIDMSKQFTLQATPELFQQVAATGRELKADVAALEARTGSSAG
jgi:actin-like ATPase involved in cell morphogenesis